MSACDDKVRLAVFDIDGTVIRGQSPVLMVLFLMNEGKYPIGKAIRAGIWGLKYKLGIAEADVDVRQSVFDEFRDMPAQETNRLITMVYRKKIVRRVRKQAMERIDWHNARGDLVVFATATFEVLADLFAEDLHAFGQVSTRMLVEDGKYTGKIDGAPVEGLEKVIRLKAFADERFGEGNWLVSHSYGDNDSDESILSLAEHPVAVSPNRRLRAIARERGWEIQEWV